MGFFANLFSDSSILLPEKKMDSKVKRVEVYYPDTYNQDAKKSVLEPDRKYDLKRFSNHEADIIQRVLKTTDTKYHHLLRSLGLVNESISIKYKPRYVLFDIVILKYEKSQNMVDRLAVALAYETKGAFFRRQAILYFEDSIKHVDRDILDLFHACSTVSVYTKFGDVYEKEHEYKKAISCFKKARSLKGASKEYLSERISKLEKKLENPPKGRKQKKPDYYDAFEADVRRAAIAFATGDYSGITIGTHPNHSA